MINVLYTLIHGDMGGVHRFLDSVFLHHTSRVRPVVLSFREGSWLKELRSRGMKVYCIDNARLRNPIRVFREVRRIILRERIDIVHSSYAWSHTLAAPAAAWSGCKLVWFHHGPVSDRRWQGAMNLVPASLLLTNSNYMAERLGRTFHGARQRGVVHYGIDSAEIAPDAERRRRFRDRWSVDDDTLAVGLVGFLDVWKGQDIFLKAAKILAEQRLKLRMFVIGGPRDGTSAARCEGFERQLRDYALVNGLQETVTFTGHVDVLDGALDAMDIFVHASTQPEPFGVVLLEAMAKGKVIIASGEGGPLEIITDGRDGMLIEPRSPEKLAAAIQHLARHPELRNRMSSAALETVKARYNPAVAARKLEDWYEQLVG